eukprot:m.25653 g.25653  ORF g.25653 m.25653 type:complete len:52 (+) comp4462_c0_seq1:148-303(+)
MGVTHSLLICKATELENELSATCDLIPSFPPPKQPHNLKCKGCVDKRCAPC